jgi:hypothetical protein
MPHNRRDHVDVVEGEVDSVGETRMKSSLVISARTRTNTANRGKPVTVISEYLKVTLVPTIGQPIMDQCESEVDEGENDA